jgi:hypothetical protein
LNKEPIMTIQPTRPTSLDWLDVAEAPELATLTGMDTLLDLAITALVAAHPELESGGPLDIERAPPSLWLAEVIVDAAAMLRVYLGRYEVAVRKERHMSDPAKDHDRAGDDIP